MADWSLPTLSSTYTNFLSQLQARDTDLALAFDGTTTTSQPTGTVRWDSTANRWKKWNGTSWAELTSTYALTGLSTTGAASIGTTLGVTGATTLATATATTPSTADNSTNVATTAYVKAQGYATVASPTFTGTPAAPTATAGTNTTQIATTAFVSSSYAPLAGATFSGNVVIPAGTASANGIQVGTGTTYKPGIYSPGTDQLALATAGTGRVFVDASGRVGIGTTSPAGALDVNGEVFARGGVSVLNGTTFGGSLVASAAGRLKIRSYNTTAADWGETIFVRNNTSTELESARLDTSGRLLLGTSTARSNFFNASVTAGLQAESTGEGSIIAAIRNVNDAPTVPVFLLAKSRGGSVGSNTIVSSGDSLGYLSYQGSDGSEFVEAARITGEVDGTTAAHNMPGRLVFSTTASGSASPTERMRIDNSGNVGIGCTPTVPLDVVGYLRSSAASQPQLILNSTASGSWKSNIRFQNSGTAKYEIGVDTGAAGANNFYFYDAVAAVNRAAITSTGVFQFDSGYGSSAAAYGCRAWVNFNGTTASPSTIRGSGNVSSVTKNGTGDYTVNFATAMVDANYSAVSESNALGVSGNSYISMLSFSSQTTSSVRFTSSGDYPNASINDKATVSIAIFR